MSVLQKFGFVLGLAVAVMLMIPFIQSGGPDPDHAAESDSGESAVSDSSVAGESADESSPSVPAGVEKTEVSSVQQAVEADVQAPTTAPNETTELNAASQASSDGASPAVTEQSGPEPTAPVQAEPQPALGAIQAAIDDAPVPSPEQVDATVGEESAMRDRFFGPFASKSRANRFAATVAQSTGLSIEAEKQAGEGWYVTVGYSDEAQRLAQRSALADATGLKLRPMD